MSQQQAELNNELRWQEELREKQKELREIVKQLKDELNEIPWMKVNKNVINSKTK